MQSMSYQKVLVSHILVTCMIRLELLKDGGPGCSMDYSVIARYFCL